MPKGGTKRRRNFDQPSSVRINFIDIISVTLDKCVPPTLLVVCEHPLCIVGSCCNSRCHYSPPVAIDVFSCFPLQLRDFFSCCCCCCSCCYMELPPPTSSSSSMRRKLFNLFVSFYFLGCCCTCMGIFFCSNASQAIWQAHIHMHTPRHTHSISVCSTICSHAPAQIRRFNGNECLLNSRMLEKVSMCNGVQKIVYEIYYFDRVIEREIKKMPVNVKVRELFVWNLFRCGFWSSL